MKAEEINIQNLLKFDPSQGVLLLNQQRMLIFSQKALGRLQKLAVHHFGFEYTFALLTQFGHSCGQDDYVAIAESGDWDTEIDKIASGPVTHMWEGIVHVEPTKIEFDIPSSKFHMTGVWRNSYEALNYLENFGEANHPVCFSLTGYASGWASKFMNTPCLAIETSCIGKGDSHCAFEIKPIQEWGNEAQLWRRALNATSSSISSLLEKEVQIRTENLELANVNLESARAIAENANKTKSQFLAKISHELRTPLNGVLGIAQLLLEEDLNQSQKDKIKMIIDSGVQQLNIINDLLDYSKIEAGKMVLETHHYSITEMMDQLCANFSILCKNKGINFQYTSDLKEQEWLDGDSYKVTQIITNLFSNAYKFTAKGGIQVDFCHDQKFMKITVSDTGIGMNKEKIALLFEPFQQADSSIKRQFGGTGLGLAICKELSQLMGGSITVESQVGMGTKFILSLPLLAGKPQKQEKMVIMDEAKNLDLKILIVDDNETNLFLIEEISKRMGCQVVKSCHGQDALDKLKSSSFDLIFMDLHMPIMNGWEAMEKINHMIESGVIPHIPVVALTADAFQETEIKCLKAGFASFISKPIRTRTLKTLLMKTKVG